MLNRGRATFLALMLASLTAALPAAAAPDCRQAEIGAGHEEFRVLFAVGSAALDASAQRSISRAASRIKGRFASTVCLVGRASLTGNVAANQRLSQARSNAVRRELLRHGVQAAVLGSRAMGITGHSFGTGEEASGERSVVIVIVH